MLSRPAQTGSMRPTAQGPGIWVSTDPASANRGIRDVATRMPKGQFISHLSAAIVWGMALPHHGTGDPVHVSVLSPQPRPRANGVIGHELDPRVTELVWLDGWLIADPASTWCQLAGILSLPDLVAAADQLVMPEGDQPPLLSVEELDAAVAARKGHRGSGQLRDALALVRSGAANRTESLVRVLLHEAGLPEPELQFTFGGPEQPVTLALAYPDFRVGIEVHNLQQGSHRQSSEPADTGWQLLSFSEADVHPSNYLATHERVSAVQAALQERGWRR